MKNFLSRLSDFVFPNFECISCSGEIFATQIPHVCNDCAGKMRVAVPGIINADVAIPKGDKVYIGRAMIAYQYGPVVKTIIMRLKYSNDGLAAVAVGGGMRDILLRARGENAKNAVYDMLIPVPLSKNRAKQRGYNQAELLAREIISVAGDGAVISSNIVNRVKNTVPQVDMTVEQRRKNQSGAFEVVDKSMVRGKAILIVDDVMTSGATVNEMAKILKRAGAIFVDAIVAARI